MISREKHIQISSNVDAFAADAKKETGDDLINIWRSLVLRVFCFTFMYLNHFIVCIENGSLGRVR